MLRDLADAGKLAGEAVDAVLESVGERARLVADAPAALTAWEIEVLRMLARGMTNKQTAQVLCANFGYDGEFHADSNGNILIGEGADYPIPDFGDVSGQAVGQVSTTNGFTAQLDASLQGTFTVHECVVVCEDFTVSPVCRARSRSG